MEEEKSNETVNEDERDIFTVDSEDFEDINKFAVAEWKATTSMKERILTMIRHINSPKSIEFIAEKAHVPEKEAKKILNNLSKQNIIKTYYKESEKMYNKEKE